MLKILEASEFSPEGKRERIDLELKADPTIGACSKFSETAMVHLLVDWTANEPAVLARVRATDPSTARC